jgi:N-acyl-D-amino-acid deacylase
MTSRRDFVTSTAAALGWVGVPPLSRPGGREADLILRNATICDGTGAGLSAGDVAVAAGRILDVGRIPGRGAQEVDLRGLVLAPGFIDIHSHGDGTLNEDWRAESVIRQGVTTIVAGQDGGSEEVAAFLGRIAAVRPAVNVATMVGFGSVRGQVIGDADRPATQAELQRMAALVEAALAVGACGGSTGLEYTPGGFASRDELVALARPLRLRRLPYSSHLRNEDDRLLASIDEAIDVAGSAGCPLQVSHLKAQGPRNWARMGEAMGRIARAKEDGIDAAFDIYPYVAYQTGLTSLFPLWSRDGGTVAFLARLDAPLSAERIRAETLAKVEMIGGWDNVLISGVRAAADAALPGQRVGGLAAALGRDPYLVTVDLLRRSEGQVGMVGFAMSEENVEAGLRHPLSMVCSDGSAVAVDGPARRGHPHPRSLGSFPRVLGHYVRERKVLSLPAAVHKMTGRPAERLRLRDRGRIAPGQAADLVAFDPDTIADRATYTDPFQYPAGIALVVVNGTIVLRDGARTEARPGQAVRPT